MSIKKFQTKKTLTAIRSPNWLVNFVPIQLFTSPNIVEPAIQIHMSQYEHANNDKDRNSNYTNQ